MTKHIGSMVLLFLMSKTALACYTPSLSDEINFRNCQLAVQRDAVEAQYYMGFMYHYRKGVYRDYQKAREWYLKAASQNHSGAQNQLGVMFELGQGVLLNYKKAKDWYLLSAQQGDADGQISVGWLYQYGKGVRYDEKEAARW
ncbi:MAG: sel1 repeat family protein, partial [Methylococcales bacterium]|nr:sel1 repeat family protein [Methylococcales bacterium]